MMKPVSVSIYLILASPCISILKKIKLSRCLILEARKQIKNTSIILASKYISFKCLCTWALILNERLSSTQTAAPFTPFLVLVVMSDLALVSIQSPVESLTFILSHMHSNAECSEHLQADVTKDVLFSQLP